ncbi:hypothetical protein BH10ACT2_BH10ACT2_20940 [soil metagenome]
MTTGLQVRITNGYSALNPGDGWLVVLAHQSMVQAGQLIGVTVASVAELVDCNGWIHEEGLTVRPLCGTRHRAIMVMTNLGRLAFLRLYRERSDGESQLAVAVGGGYLRSDTMREALIVNLLHLPQLAYNNVSLLMPQSIGPLRLFPAFVVRRVLQGRTIHVRDDTSLRQLEELGISAIRTPDLAVMEIARNPPKARVTGVGVVLAPRAVRGASVIVGIRELMSRISQVEFGYQSEIGTSNKDKQFQYDSFHAVGTRPLSEIYFSDSAPAPILVAGRLHAALRAISMGFPAIHLGYERKSYGAYSDLGLSEYVIDIRQQSWPKHALEAIEKLQASPAKFWLQLSEALPAIDAQRIDFIERLASHLRPFIPDRFPT